MLGADFDFNARGLKRYVVNNCSGRLRALRALYIATAVLFSRLRQLVKAASERGSGAGKRCHFLVTALALLALPLASQASPMRERLSLDASWKFHLGDDWPGAARLDQLGVSSGPIAESFDDTSWRLLDLPHDWAVELPFDRAADTNHGFKPVGFGFPKNNIGWYRRKFQLAPSDAGKRIWLSFDGVFRDATVWINGWLVRRHEGGYDSFREDITNVVRFGSQNEVVVRVDVTRFEGWFYEGAGIYRHVWLEKTAPIAIAPNGIFVFSRFAKNVPSRFAQVQVEAEVLNTTGRPSRAVVTCQILSPDGRPFRTFSASKRVEAHAQCKVSLASPLLNPELWSPDSPKLYKLVTRIAVDGSECDNVETAFGVRTLAFDPREGFLLNGKPYPIHGTCNHQDHAGVGVALPDALQSFRIARLKEFGCNAIRTSHNAPTPELLEACDRLGMLVMDEYRLPGSDSLTISRWDEQLRRDRNHPSVFVWCIGNEERGVEDTPQAANVAVAMQDEVSRLDPTRLTTYAAPEGDVFQGINSVIEVRGWNYNYGPDMDAYHSKHPDQPNIGSEQASVVGTRGIYQNEYQRGYVSAFDDVWPGWSTTAESWWSFFAKRPWLSGGFVWTGFDYRGEPTPYQWPCISSHFGIVDTCGFPKDAFYYYKAWWTNKPVLHLLPHWNWPGKEGQFVRVDAYSNCRQVELVLNGKSLGRKDMMPDSKLTWQVKYEPGTLTARGYDGHGKVTAETSVETTGEPIRVQLTPDRSVVSADGADVCIYTVSAVDAKGRIVPTANNKIEFATEGDGQIIGVGNGDPTCHEPDTFVADATPGWSRSLFNGLGQIIVRSTRHAGFIRLIAKSSGLAPGEAVVQTRDPLKPSHETLTTPR